jgi:hypothetical protein
MLAGYSLSIKADDSIKNMEEKLIINGKAKLMPKSIKVQLKCY